MVMDVQKKHTKQEAKMKQIVKKNTSNFWKQSTPMQKMGWI
jgi:hypothetical protein